MSKQVKAFFKKFRPMAIKAATGSKIFPDTILSAAYVESARGTSQLSAKYNNFFGVKAGKTWTGKTINLNTREVINGKTVMMLEPFRVYDSPEQSFVDYVKLVSSPRYVRAGVTKAATPEEQIKAIKAAGYATDPNYTKILISILNAGRVAALPLILIVGIVSAYFFFQ